MSEGFLIKGVFQKMYPMADRGWRITIDTPELIPDDVARLYVLNKMPIAMVMTPDMEEVEQIYEIKNIPKEQSPSGIQRKIIYQRWENHGRQGSFRDYYEARMRELAHLETRLLEEERKTAIKDF